MLEILPSYARVVLSERIMSTKKDAQKNISISYAKKINSAWKAAFQNILLTGRLLTEAKEKLDKAAWNLMIDNELTFKRRTADKLIEIASDPRISSTENASFLPPHWSTLYTLKYLTDEEFTTAVDKGLIHTDMMRKDAERLRSNSVSRKKYKGFSTSNTATKDIPINDKNNDEEEKNEYVDNNSINDSMASLLPYNSISDEEAKNIEYALNELSESFNLKLFFDGYSSEKVAKISRKDNLATKMQKFILGRSPLYNRKSPLYYNNQTISEKETIQIEDTFYQFLTGKRFKPNSDGTFVDNDIRNPNNPFGSKGEKIDDDWIEIWTQNLYFYCSDHNILTRYSPLESIDYIAYLKMLVYRHATFDNEQGRLEIEKELLELNDLEHAIRGGSIAYEKAIADGMPYEEAYSNILFGSSDCTKRAIEQDFDYENPGDALAAYEMLIR